MEDRDERKLVLYLAPLLAMEGGDVSVSLLPFHQSLLIRVINYILSNPEQFIIDYDSDDDTMRQQVRDILDDISMRLAVD